MTGNEDVGYRDAGSVPRTTIALRSFQLPRLAAILFGPFFLVSLLTVAWPHLGISGRAPIALTPFAFIIPGVWLVATKLRPVRPLTYLFQVTDTDLWLETPAGVEIARFSSDTLHTACTNYPMRGRSTTYARPGVRLLFHGKDLLIGCMTPREGWHAVPMVERIPDFNVDVADLDFLKGRL